MSARERRSIWRIGPESTWTTIVPVVFIIVSLLSLLVLPLVVQRHTSRMRQEITSLAEPARRAANQIQTDLAIEVDKIIAFQVTGQPNYRVEYYLVVEREEQNRKRLDDLLTKLESERQRRDLAALFAQTARWHRGVVDAEFLSRQLPSEIFLTRLFEKHPPYEKSLSAAAELEIAMQEGIEDRLQKIRSAERISASLTIILTLLALTSALMVAGLGRQMRLLAREAVRRRRDAEREAEYAQAARAAAEREERRAAFIAGIGQELATSLEYQQTINTILKLLVPNVGEAGVLDLAEQTGALRRAAAAHHDTDKAKRLAEMIGTERSDVPEGIVRIMQSREPHLLPPSPDLLAFVSGESSDDAASVLIMPLVSRGQTIGVISLLSHEATPFTPSDLPLFIEIARRASLAIDNARLYLESQQAVRAREEVLAIVSHDLRNPLNAVTLGASLLKHSEALTEEDREQIDMMDVSARQMARLIADLLDVTRMEGGKHLPVEPEPVDVAALLEEAERLFASQASAAGVGLGSRIEGQVPRVQADRHRVIQVLSNLVGNAIKFTPASGSITLMASPGSREVIFSVADDGPGIPAEDREQIFSRFWQAKRAERHGAGLGLAIAKGIVESHGGRIWVESEEGRGTTFRFTIPACA